MTYLSRHRLSVTCTASGATYLTDEIIGGYLHAINYTKASASAFATASTCVISAVCVTSAGDMDVTHDIMTFVGTSAAQMLYPRREAQTTAGTTMASAAPQRIPLVNSRIRVVVASGGASGRGTFDFLVEGR